MTDRIKTIIERYYSANVSTDNYDWIGSPSVYEVEQQPSFEVKGNIPDDSTAEVDVIIATRKATANMLAVSIYYYIANLHKKIRAANLFNSGEALGRALKWADEIVIRTEADWREETKKIVAPFIESKFGKNCIKVTGFEDLARWYDDSRSQPFEDWFCEQTQYVKEGIPEGDYQLVWEDLYETFAETKFAVCVPDGITHNQPGRPPLHECKIIELEWA